MTTSKQIVGLSIVFVFGLLLILYSSKINLTIGYKDYPIEISVHPQKGATIQDFRFFFDFSSQKGNLIFRLSGKDLIPNNVQVEFPEEISIISYYIHNDTHNLNETFLTNYYRSMIVFHRFNENMNDATFEINVSSNESFYPNGRFILNLIAENMYGVYYSGGNDMREVIRFRLGNYICYTPCFYDKFNTDPRIINNEVIVLFNNVMGSYFVINSYDGSKAFQKTLFSDLGIALISGIILIIVDIHIKTSKQPKKRKLKQHNV